MPENRARRGRPIERESPLLGRMAWGLRLGACYGVILSGVAVMQAVANPGGFDRQGIDPGVAILLYLAGGSLGGLVLGVARPLMRGRATVIVATSVAALPASLLIGIVALPRDGGWTSEHSLTVLILAALMGAVLGWMFEDKLREQGPHKM